MKISFQWLKEYVAAKGDPEKIAKDLTMHIFETNYYKQGKDIIFDVDVLPNRGADSLSVFGIAEEIATIQNLNLKFKKISFARIDKRIGQFLNAEIREKDLVKRYMVAAIQGIRIGVSPVWLKGKLESVGINSINNLVDAANFVMLELGQPLHIFDADKINGGKIIVRKANNKEKIKILSGEEINLTNQDLIIADNEKPLAIAGIIGGQESAVSENTKNIVIEAANFDALSIRRSSLRHNIKTESSYRFEHNLDPNLVEIALERAVSIIKKAAGGNILKGWIDIYPEKVNPVIIGLDLEDINRLLGTNLTLSEVEKILKRLRFNFKKSKKENSFIISIPTKRRDLKIREDLIEEIGRLYGYENIHSKKPLLSAAIYPSDSEFGWQWVAKKYLQGLGFNETRNYSLVNNLDVEIGGGQNIELLNSVSEDRKFLRDNLLAGLLKNIELNSKFINVFKIFELGKIFFWKRGLGKDNKAKPEEKIYLTATLYSSDSASDSLYALLKGDLEVLFERLGVAEKWFDTYHPVEKSVQLKNWNKESTAEIKIREEGIGFIGEVSKKTLKQYEIKGNVMAFELDFGKLIRFLAEEREYAPIPKYPAVARDISLLIEMNQKISKILSFIYETGGALVEDVDLFDIYAGDDIVEGKKSLSFHIIYRSSEKTLTDKEVNELHGKIGDGIRKETGAEIR